MEKKIEKNRSDGEGIGGGVLYIHLEIVLAPIAAYTLHTFTTLNSHSNLMCVV